jgi:hypothetical protein
MGFEQEADLEEPFRAGQRVKIPKWRRTGDKPGRHCGTIVGKGLWKNWYKVKADDGKYYQVCKDVILTAKKERP